MDALSKGKMIIYFFIFIIIMLLVINALMPTVTEGADVIANTTNVSEYVGMQEINSLSPLLVYGGLFFCLIAGLFWLVFGNEVKGSAREIINNLRGRGNNNPYG